MRRRSMIVAFLALLTFPAIADPDIPPGQDGGPDKHMLIEFGSYFLPVASAFGCNDFRWAAFGAGKRTINLEYVPAGDDIKAWTRMTTVTLYPLPPSPDAQRDVMLKLQQSLLRAYSKVKLISQFMYSAQNGGPRLFIEYEIGEGVQKEHNSGAFLRAGTRSAAFVQIQSRGEQVDAKDAADMKLYAEDRLQLSGK